MTELTSYLSTGWVDADGAVQLLLGHATFHGCTKALRHLSRVWTQIVEPDDSILQCVRNKTSCMWHNKGTSCWFQRAQNWCVNSVKVEIILRCPVYCRWSWSSICCYLCWAQWTPEARTECGTPKHGHQTHSGALLQCATQQPATLYKQFITSVAIFILRQAGLFTLITTDTSNNNLTCLQILLNLPTLKTKRKSHFVVQIWTKSAVKFKQRLEGNLKN